ncbi:MAG: protein-export chaperone SecB [Pseudomonadota bacterium]|nr:protein-export chaperone SecB [Pseudomonadota bacterium]
MSEENKPNQEFGINQIYIKDLSFEAILPLYQLKADWRPNVSANLDNTFNKVDEDFYEISIKMKVSVSVEEKTVFVVEIEQAGLFKLGGFDEKQMGQLLNSFCPNILFPYLRESVASCVVKGGYPALHLSPVDFDARYVEMLDKKKAS